MNENTQIKISVRNLVEFILRSGDIDNRHRGGVAKDTEAMLAGGKIHRKIQSKMGGNYKAEVPLSIFIPYDDLEIIVDGRADGIIDSGNDEVVTIDEIKGVKRSIMFINEPVYVHKAQAMCYAYMYAAINDKDKMRITMTYVNLDTEEIKRFEEEYTLIYLKNWFYQIVDEYYKWAKYLIEKQALLLGSAKELQFPYEYRAGQKNVVTEVYKAIRNKVNLYVQAPTGVGKTLSSVFPAVKAIGEDKIDKIFYLTAKTMTQNVASSAYNILREHGLCMKTCIITAKEKMCVMDETKCNPEYCGRAKGHFDRINDAIYDIITNESDITREKVLEYADKHCVCPFEMNLDISDWCDGIICDYNYAFDPRAKLKRYFADNGTDRFALLVDESHNLVDRAREMYSAMLLKDEVLRVRRIFEDKDKRIHGALTKLNAGMLHYKRMCDEKYIVLPDLEKIILPILRFTSAFERYTEEHNDFEGREEAMELYFKAKNFGDVYEIMDDKYEIYASFADDTDFFIKLMCINPSERLSECMSRIESTVFFSATLLPVNYYKFLFTGDVNDYATYIDSPFDKKNRLIMIGRDITSKYTMRGPKLYDKIAKYIWEIVSPRTGNYMVFCPSYAMMRDIYSAFMKLELYNVETVVQENSMRESEREAFLKKFEHGEDKTLIGFCIMGGIFSEGIDLKDELLIGTIVVGTGLPQVCPEREIIMDYFAGLDKNGFDYAYKIPGMNKVMQAAGRVIRTDSDKGIIALLDSRFLEHSYGALYPREWDDIEVTDITRVGELVENWWANTNDK